MSPINNNQTVPLINQPLPRGRLFRGKLGKTGPSKVNLTLWGGLLIRWWHYTLQSHYIFRTQHSTIFTLHTLHFIPFHTAQPTLVRPQENIFKAVDLFVLQKSFTWLHSGSLIGLVLDQSKRLPGMGQGLTGAKGEKQVKISNPLVW